MDYQNEYVDLRKKFYNRRKEMELMDDAVNEAMATRAVPITVALSAATYFAIREGFLKSNGVYGMMRKNLLCMCIGVGASLIGLRENYTDKLTLFYNAYYNQEFLRKINASRRNIAVYNDAIPFVQPDHLNLDLERPQFEGFDTNQSVEPKKDGDHYRHFENVTYEELQRKNREKYALKHNVYY